MNTTFLCVFLSSCLHGAIRWRPLLPVIYRRVRGGVGCRHVTYVQVSMCLSFDACLRCTWLDPLSHRVSFCTAFFSLASFLQGVFSSSGFVSRLFFRLHGIFLLFSHFSLGFVSHGVFSSCRQALEELIRHQQGAPFAAPVDPARDRCPDYLSVIEQPMDLG